jgi:hypothetical protein
MMRTPDPDPHDEPESNPEPQEPESLSDTEGELQDFLGSDQTGDSKWFLVEESDEDQGRWHEVEREDGDGSSHDSD